VISLNLVLAGLRLGLKNHQVGKNWILLICFALKVHNVLLCDAMYQHSQQFSSRLYLVFIYILFACHRAKS
jgi:uncharacterized membrane protein YoaK (UPF0700 family)